MATAFLLRTWQATIVDGNIRLVSESDWTGVAGWVLVGGASSRMGRDKALMEVNGTPLALAVAGAMGRICRRVSLVGDPARYANLGLPVIPDAMRGLGPLSGIEAALGATDSDWNLVAACDMPALDELTLRRIVDGAAEDGAIPRYADGTIEPLCAVYHRRCHDAAVAALSRGVRRVSEFIGGLKVRYVQIQDAGPFQNLNTPGDLDNFRRG